MNSQKPELSTRLQGRVPPLNIALLRTFRHSGIALIAAVGRRLAFLWRLRGFRWSVLFAPTLVTASYCFFLASDQYESQAVFVVRSASRPQVPQGLAFLTQLGFGRSQDDSFIVQEFIGSRDAIEKIRANMPLEKLFGREDADLLARYPSILYALHDEEFHRYFRRMVSVVHVDNTGISTLRVRAFAPDDAQKIASALLALSEDFVNRMNQRVQEDAVRNSLDELRNAQQRIIDAQAALTNFRNRELMVDPMQNAVSLAELIASLSAELASTQAQILELKAASPNSPQVASLQRKSTALVEQITHERSRIAGDVRGLASRMAEYERLTLEREFANKMLSTAESELARSRAEAARQLLYLERIAEPQVADYPQYPKRFRNVLTVAVANVLGLLIAWLMYTGISEHAAARH